MRSRSKWYRFAWPEMIVLPIAAIVGGGVFALWVFGVLALVGYPHQRFDSAMFDTAIKAALILILPIWLFLRAADIGVRVLKRLFRPSLRIAVSAGLRPNARAIR